MANFRNRSVTGLDLKRTEKSDPDPDPKTVVTDLQHCLKLKFALITRREKETAGDLLYTVIIPISDSVDILYVLKL